MKDRDQRWSKRKQNSPVHRSQTDMVAVQLCALSIDALPTTSIIHATQTVY